MARIRAHDKKKIYIGFNTYLKAIPVKLEDTFRFDCLNCGACCAYPPTVNPQENQAMAKHKGMSKKDFFDEYVVLQPHLIYEWITTLRKVGDECVFYSKKNGKSMCDVHKAKPNLCKAKPLHHISDFHGDLESFELFYEPCRGFGRGEEQTIRNWIEKNELEKAWLEDTAYYSKLAELNKTLSIWELKNEIEKMFKE